MGRFVRSSRQVSFPRTQRHRPSWSLGPSGTVARTMSGSSLFLTGAQATIDEVTIVRTRGILVLQLIVADAALAGYTGAVGICNVTENAFNAGIASIPTPVTDIAWDGWLWYQLFALNAITATIADGVNAGAMFKQFTVDSKAMRKTNVTDVIVGVIEVTEATNATLHARLDTRMLSKNMS